MPANDTERRLSDVEAAIAEIPKLHERLKVLEAGCATKHRAVERAREELAEEVSEHDTAIALLQSEVKEARATMRQLTEWIERASATTTALDAAVTRLEERASATARAVEECTGVTLKVMDVVTTIARKLETPREVALGR